VEETVRRYCLVLFVGLFCGWTPAQEVKHAPTVDQCRADQRLWLDKVEDTSSANALPSFRVLDGWSHEMLDCQSVDPENHNLYFNVLGEIEAVMETRLGHFLDRHGLYGKFIEEDEAGKR